MKFELVSDKEKPTTFGDVKPGEVFRFDLKGVKGNIQVYMLCAGSERKVVDLSNGLVLYGGSDSNPVVLLDPVTLIKFRRKGLTP